MEPLNEQHGFPLQNESHGIRRRFLHPYLQLSISIVLTASAQIFFKIGVDSRLGTPWYGFPVSLWIWTGISAILLSPFSMMAVGQKEAAKQRRQRCLRWPIRWIQEFSSNEFGFNDPGSGNDDFGVTVFVEIIPDTGIPTGRAGSNCRLSDILKDLAEPIPLPELESPGLSLISPSFIHP